MPVLRILFVDDDVHLLDALQDVLRPRRHEWQVTLASGSGAALQHLARDPVDVVVSDVRMPGMDGLQFLETVRRQHPEVIRIVLTGHADSAAAQQLLQVAHQYLAKPCDPLTLQTTLERAARICRLITDPQVKALIGGIERLPPRPRIYNELATALARPHTTMERIARILEKEPALCAKILQIVNSAFFRLSRTITRLEDAVVHLGLEQIRSLVLQADIFQCAAKLSPRAGLSMDALARHCLLVARMTGHLIPDRHKAGEAFLAAMVHEVGLLVLGLEQPERLARCLGRARADGVSLPVVEKQIFGVTSAQVGGYLLGLWGLPYPLLEAVVHHQTPRDLMGRSLNLVGALHVANALACQEGSRPLGATRVDPLWLAEAGLESSWQAWEVLVKQEAIAVATL